MVIGMNFDGDEIKEVRELIKMAGILGDQVISMIIAMINKKSQDWGKAIYGVYQGFVDAGFTKEEAFILLLDNIQSINNLKRNIGNIKLK